jgi:predicted DCC family thiol-disulfide oxidoreductase YuxK
MNRPPADQDRSLTVLYDGACPLCSREIAWYRRKTAREAIDWLDISICPDAALPGGIPRDQALARFHVIEPGGRVLTGARAFVRLWLAFPGLRSIALLARLPLVAPLLEVGYRLFLVLRPRLTRRKAASGHASKPADTCHCTILKQ